MEDLYNELLSREKYLNSLQQTEQIKGKLSECKLMACRVQELLLIKITTIKCPNCNGKGYHQDGEYKNECGKCIGDGVISV